MGSHGGLKEASAPFIRFMSLQKVKQERDNCFIQPMESNFFLKLKANNENNPFFKRKINNYFIRFW